MADTQTTTRTLNMTLEFGDGTEKTLTQDNPISQQATLITRINALSTSAATNSIFISDNAATFTRIRAAKIVNRTVTKLDMV